MALYYSTTSCDVMLALAACNKMHAVSRTFPAVVHHLVRPAKLVWVCGGASNTQEPRSRIIVQLGAAQLECCEYSTTCIAGKQLLSNSTGEPLSVCARAFQTAIFAGVSRSVLPCTRLLPPTLSQPSYLGTGAWTSERISPRTSRLLFIPLLSCGTKKP